MSSGVYRRQGRPARRRLSTNSVIGTAASYVQRRLGTSNNSFGSAATTYTSPTLTTALSAGNLAVICFSLGVSGSAFTTITDTKGNTWNIDSQTAGGSGVGSVMLATSVLTTALTTSDTVTINWTGAVTSVQLNITVDEFTGCPGTAQYKQAVLASSPITYWRLNETSGTSATDLGSGGNTGTYHTTYTQNQTSPLVNPDSVAKGTLFTNGWMSVGANLNPANLQPTGALTIEMWLKATSWVGGASIWDNKNEGTGKTGYKLQVNDNTGVLLVYTADGANADTIHLNTNAGVSSAVWHHLAYTYQGGGSPSNTLYVDGAAVAATQTGSLPSALTYSGAGPPALASDGGAFFGTAPFSGAIAEFAFYNAALSSSTINTHYLRGHGSITDGTATALTQTSGTTSLSTNATPAPTGRDLCLAVFAEFTTADVPSSVASGYTALGTQRSTSNSLTLAYNTSVTSAQTVTGTAGVNQVYAGLAALYLTSAGDVSPALAVTQAVKRGATI